jgi:hypothetical protein
VGLRLTELAAFCQVTTVITPGAFAASAESIARMRPLAMALATM